VTVTIGVVTVTVGTVGVVTLAIGVLTGLLIPPRRPEQALAPELALLDS